MYTAWQLHKKAACCHLSSDKDTRSYTACTYVFTQNTLQADGTKSLTCAPGPHSLKWVPGNVLETTKAGRSWNIISHGERMGVYTS